MAGPLSAALGIEIPFADHLGLELEEYGSGHSRLAVTLTQELLNSWRVAHGGVVMTLLDIALSMAGRSTDPKATGAATVDLSLSFLAPGRGERLVAEGRVLRAGRTLAFCEGEVVGGDGELVAKGMGTFRMRRAHAAPTPKSE